MTKGTGAKVRIEVDEGLSKSFAISPTKGFEYHVHVSKVGPGNNCMATGGHLDPTNVGAIKCNPATPAKCQEGDLSGRKAVIGRSYDISMIQVVTKLLNIKPNLHFS